MYFLLTTFLLFGFCAGNGFKPGTQISDVNEVQIETYPFMVNIEYKKAFRCSGSLLSLDSVLTVAQCVNDIDVSLLRVRAGTNWRDILGELRNVGKVTVHPNFNISTLDSDLAIVKLKSAFVQSSKIDITTVASVVPLTGRAVAMVGWGSSAPGTWLAQKLLESNMQLIYLNDCMYNYRGSGSEVTGSMICAGGADTGACQGDTGDPLLFNNQIIGISSWSFGCGGLKYPPVFTAVYKYVPWITNAVKN